MRRISEMDALREQFEEEEALRRCRLKGSVDHEVASPVPHPPLEYIYTTPSSSHDNFEDDDSCCQDFEAHATGMDVQKPDLISRVITPSRKNEQDPICILSHPATAFPLLPLDTTYVQAQNQVALDHGRAKKSKAVEQETETRMDIEEDEDTSAPPHIIAAETTSDDENEDDDDDLWPAWEVVCVEANYSFDFNEREANVDRVEKRHRHNTI